MNKQQVKQMQMIQAYINNGLLDNAAKSLSSMIRSAISNKAKQEMTQFAIENKLVHNSNFVA